MSSSENVQAAQAAQQEVPAAPTQPVEEEKKGEEEKKQAVELAPDEKLSDVFVKLDEGVPSDIIESLCVECNKNGETRFMYTKIPMFKEIILSSFSCEECGFRNNEVQFGGKLGDHGCTYNLVVTDQDGLNRSVVKSEFATIKIPELDLEIPPMTQKGSIKTVEGFLLSTIEGISELQEERRKYDPAVAAQIDAFIERITSFREGREFPFNFELIDPSGNSFVQNPNAPNVDIACISKKYIRSMEDYQKMGYNVDEASKYIEEDSDIHAKMEGVEMPKPGTGSTKAIKTTKEEQDALLEKVQKIANAKKLQAYAQREVTGGEDEEAEITAAGIDFSKPIDEQGGEEDDVKKEVITFPSPCPGCFHPGTVKMCVATIPYFKEIIIMAYSCDVCGHKSTEIKQGGGISGNASKITFNVTEPEDLNRDVFKSDTTFVAIPEIDLELQPGTLGSVYTTVEGVLQKIIDHLKEANPFGKGDSRTSDKFREFIGKMEELVKGDKPFTLILDDPLSNCFIYNPLAPAEDPKIQVEVYERTDEQNEELGINDMVV